jgi:hypothetical protein
MNTAYKHLDSKLRIASLSITQWCGVVAGASLAIGWGVFLHPLSGTLNTIVAVYIGGVPAIFAWLCSEAQIDLPMRITAFLRWKRHEDRYLPGVGATQTAYVVLAPELPHPQPARELDPATSNLEALWQ